MENDDLDAGGGGGISRLGFSSRNWAKDYEVIDLGPRESPPVAWPFARDVECVACVRGESEFQPACRQAYTRVPYSTRNQSYQPLQYFSLYRKCQREWSFSWFFLFFQSSSSWTKYSIFNILVQPRMIGRVFSLILQQFSEIFKIRNLRILFIYVSILRLGQLTSINNTLLFDDFLSTKF